MAALFKGRLFAGALFATAIFSHSDQIPVTPEVPSSGGGIYREIPTYTKAKHVKLQGKTWQEQETYGYIGIKYDLAAQHKVFALGKTSQEQSATGSITASNRTFADTFKPQIAQKVSALVSAYSLPEIATAQIQEVSGVISVKVAESIGHEPDISVVNESLTTAAISSANTYQNQHIEGRITLSAPALVSTHYQSNASTAQVQEISGKISTHHFADVSNMVSVKAATYQQQEASGRITKASPAIPHVAVTTASTYQQQAISGKVTTDEDEMLMALLALMELDDDVA